MALNVGASDAAVNAKQVNFSDGTVQTTSSGLSVAPLVGVLVATGGNPSVVFANPYIASAAPIVIITALDGLATSGKQWGVTINGSPGAWTGFTIVISGSVFGGFNYIVFGNPN